MKQKILAIFCIAPLLLILIPVCIQVATPKTEYYKDNLSYRQHFGVFRYNTLNHAMTQEEKKIGEELFAEVISAMAYSGTREDCPFSKPLDSLCEFTPERQWTRITNDTRFITFDQHRNKSYLWIEENVWYYDDNELVFGGGPAPMLVICSNRTGTWKIQQIIRVP